ncbi:MAG: lipoate--protein ligase family protein [Parachlamydiaceae bacterium]|nr:lipoate--protein ligase family protein [Parachlamydiaceae bacterium]
MHSFHFLSFEGLSIFEQLQIEEALFRADNRNWCLVNHGTSPAIVMGISGKQSQHINSEQMIQKPIPVIRRFSGGGTVVVDEQTLFYTLIGNRSILDFPCYPDELLRWTEKLYAPAFAGINFSLRDNDYIIKDRKFGGNAQYISKDRWLHHSSLLWDYNANMMKYLLMPPKMPAYRNLREHSSFLCRLSDHFGSSDLIKTKMIEALQSKLTLVPTSLAEIKPLFERDYRRFTKLINGHSDAADTEKSGSSKD